MNEKFGFMPFSAVGAVILMLVVAMIGHAVWMQHWHATCVIEDIAHIKILTAATSVQNDLQRLANYAIYKALWDISKHAGDYENNLGRKLALEKLAARYFTEFTKDLQNVYRHHDIRIELELPNKCHHFNLQPTVGGNVLARVELVEQASVKIRTWDNKLLLVLPIENFEVFVDSRYFLLQERMNAFLDGCGNINTTWGAMEYAWAWGGAWLNGNIELSETRSKAFFKTAWAVHELNTFGSADYWSAAANVLNAGINGTSKNIFSELSDRNVQVTPIKAADLKQMHEHFNRAISAVRITPTYFNNARRHIESAKAYAAQHRDNQRDNAILENIRSWLKRAIAEIDSAREKISEVDEQFEQLLRYVSSRATRDMVMAIFYQSFTSRTVDERYPSLTEQVRWGTNGAAARLINLRETINTRIMELKFSKLDNLLTDLLNNVDTLVEAILAEPVPKRWVEFTSYVQPGAYPREPPRPIKERAEIYIDGVEEGTISSLEVVLEKAKQNLERLKELSEVEPGPQEIKDLINEELNQRLKEISPNLTIDRGWFYEILPPAPIRSSPGISVFHDIEIESVDYRREDPAGWFGSSIATPIPLWFIGITLWWGGWETTIKLKDKAVEEIFDFENPTLLRPLDNGHAIVHKPLAYRYEIPIDSFKIRVVVISLRPFTISTK